MTSRANWMSVFYADPGIGNIFVFGGNIGNIYVCGWKHWKHIEASGTYILCVVLYVLVCLHNPKP